MERRGKHIDALRDFRTYMAQQLRSQQASGFAVTGNTQVQFAGARIVGFVIPYRCLSRKRIKTRLPRFLMTKARASGN